MKNVHHQQFGILIQSRMSSTRFPGKMLETINEMALVQYIYQRCQQAQAGTVAVLTSQDVSDDELALFCEKHGIEVYRGDLNNVLKRYISAAQQFNLKYLVRVCGDTPFVDIDNMTFLLNKLVDEKLDYCAFERKTCAACFYSEAVSLKALEQALASNASKEDCEHVTKYIIDHPQEFKTALLDADLNPEFMHNIRLTVDYPQDLNNVRQVVGRLDDKLVFTSRDVLNVIQNKELTLCP